MNSIGINKNSILILALASLLISSCSVHKHLEPEQKVYRKTNVEIQESGVFEGQNVETDLKEVAVPKPNQWVLGLMPVRVWLYNLAGDSVPDKGFRNWLQTQAGSPPVIYQHHHKDQSLRRIQNKLFALGYFESSVEAEMTEDEHLIEITYKVDLGNQYMISEIIVDSSLNKLDYPLKKLVEESLLEDGQPYNLEDLRNERSRIAKHLQAQGYYFFNEHYIIFKLDSNRHEKNLRLHVSLKNNIPENAFRKYRISNITVYPDYSLQDNSNATDTSEFRDLVFVDSSKHVSHRLITASIDFSTGKVYSSQAYSNTLNRLMGLGIFKYANITFEEDSLAPDSLAPALNMTVFLTQHIPVTTRAEIQAVTKSNSYSGPFLFLSYMDRNAFKGSELFQLDLNGGFESQWTNQNNSFISYELGLDAGLSFPRFVFPFYDFEKFPAKKYTPKTNVGIGFSFQNRVRYFTSSALDASYSYYLQFSEYSTHDFRLISISYSNLLNTTAKFEELLDENPLLQESFDEKFIFSIGYTGNFESKLNDERALKQYSRLGIELAGNVINSVEELSEKLMDVTSDGKMFGVDYAQYARLTAEYRLVYELSKKTSFVNRLDIGLAWPYGFSQTMPFSKQFFVGGSNNLRGFHFRSIGPGSYQSADDDRYLFTHNGNLKLVGNMELRFPLAGPLRAALFADAGNVWLWEENDEKQGSGFLNTNPMQEIALNTGFGLRVDVEFFVLRLDLGIPLRSPYKINGSNWIAFKPFSKSWINEYPVLNIALGYPF